METAEVDDRLVWTEERICSSLKGSGDEVKTLLNKNTKVQYSPQKVDYIIMMV